MCSSKVKCLLSSRATVGSLQTSLMTATFVAKKGNPNSEKQADWVKISCKYTWRMYLLIKCVWCMDDKWAHGTSCCTFPLYCHLNWFLDMNSSTSLEDGDGSCGGIPSHIHISIWSLVTETPEGTAQSNIQAIQVRCVYRSPNHAAFCK